jgi:hypothetical protein
MLLSSCAGADDPAAPSRGAAVCPAWADDVERASRRASPSGLL